MTVELNALFGATAILLALLFVQGLLVPIYQGFPWGLGPRDEPKQLTALQGRTKRATANQMEAMMLFAPLVIIAHLTSISTPLTILGANIFLAARAVYVVLYLTGIPVLRTIVWAVGLTATLMIGYEVIRAGF